MFRARRFAELPPSKRSGGLLSPPHPDLMAASGGAAQPTAHAKRQRLALAAAEAYFHQSSAQEPLSAELHNHLSDEHDGEHDDAPANVLVETPEGTIAALAALPSALAEELRREGGGEPPRLVLWHEELARAIALPLPDELDDDEVLQPFLFALYGQSLSLMAIGRSGVVLFWEDVDLPYESVPLSLQIPLQHDEALFTSADAVVAAADDESVAALAAAQRQYPEEELKSVVCWSNQGNVWEVAMEDRRIRVRAFEKRSGGFLSGLTRSVSQFFFASSAARAGAGSSSSSGSGGSGSGAGHYGASGGELDVNLPIKYVKVVPSGSGDDADSGAAASDDETADMLVLFSNGVVERRTFSTSDAMDCACASVRHFDATRVAISYFSDHFPHQHLAKVEVVALPYALDRCFALLVAFVCASHHDATATVKYVVFQFALGEPASETPEPEWACVLDYEPTFSEEDSRRFFQVECLGVARGAFYLVWTQAAPIQFASILLPRAGQTSVRYAAFSLQGSQHRTAVGFSARVEANAFAGDAVKGSVSFLLLEDESKPPGGTLCVATASNMQKVEALPSARTMLSTTSLEKSRRRLEEASRVAGDTPRFLVGNHDVQEYVRLLTTHFRDDPYASSPLRIGAADALAVAQAAVAIDFQILDAKPSSGLRWSKEDTDDARGAAKQSGSGASPGAARVTPKLVRFQLEEKCTRRAEFLAFLQRRCATVWQTLVKSPELSRYLTEDEEKLHAAISLSKFQGALHAATATAPALASGDSDSALSPSAAGRLQRRLTGEFLLHAIEKTVEARGYHKEQLRLAGYNAFDVFYCEVSKIADVFPFLSAEVAKLSTSIGESDPTYLYSLLEAGYSMLSLLKPSSGSAKAPAASAFPATGSWAFTRQVREVIVDQVARLTALVGYSSAVPGGQRIRWEHDEIFEVTDQLKSLGSLLLDAYLRFLPTAQGEEAEDLRKEAELTKRYVLNPLVYVATNTALGDTSVGDGGGASAAAAARSFEHDGFLERKRSELFAQCVKLSEKYSYYEGMAFLAYAEDAANLSKLDYVVGKAPKSAATKRLEAYCKAFDGFAQFLFRWYGGEERNPWPVSAAFETRARATMLAYLLGNAKLFGASLHEYMGGHKELSRRCWLSAIAVERYDETAACALREAERERGSLAKRKNLASIAKIAALAAPDTTRNEENLQQIKRELVRTRIQEVLQQLQAADTRPLPTDALVDACLEASSAVGKSDPIRTSLFLMALEAAEAVESESADEFGATLAKAWRHCLVSDEALWESVLEEHASGVNEQRLEQLMRQTLLFSAMTQYASRQQPAHEAPVALTAELIDDLIEHEEHEHSIIGVRSRQLFAKTLSFALAQ
ncbi:hypothetical protein PybrP1_012607 [[Pythium] brassicae (nom. inval.)]|nr:hypothetical protein PybrP1_012607 [[Pythium] brassicae (nom. inval.)]